MKTMIKIILEAVTLFPESALIGQEKQIPVKNLPGAVTAAFKASYPNALVKKAAAEVEEGVTFYEIESRDGKIGRELLYKADGTVVEIEETLDAGALPEAVRLAVDRVRPKGRILRAEKISRGAVLSCEVLVVNGAGQKEICLDPEGKVLTEKTGPEGKSQQ